MIGLVKRMFCDHRWSTIGTIENEGNGSYYDSLIYGCEKCGKTVERHGRRDIKWMFKQKYKGREVDES